MSRVEEYTTSRREHRPRVATWRRSLIKSLDTVRAQYPSLDTQQERRTIDNWVMEVKNIFGLWTGEFLNRDIREMADVDYLRKQFSAMAEAIKESSSKGGLRIYKTPNEIVEGMHARQARIVFSHPLINHIDGILNVGGLCGLDKTMLDAWKEEAYKVFGLPDAVTEEISSNSDVLFLTRRFDALGDLIRDKNPLIVKAKQLDQLPDGARTSTWLTDLPGRAHRASHSRKRQHSPPSPHPSFVPNERVGPTDVAVVKKRR